MRSNITKRIIYFRVVSKNLNINVYRDYQTFGWGMDRRTAAVLRPWIRSAEMPGDVVMKIETQQQSGWAMDGRTGGVGGDVVMRNGTQQQQSGWDKDGLLCRVCATMNTFRLATWGTSL